ncbi:histidinol-phosphate transaminase [Serendipita sp. 396]|nr:histidinol-phosphate transaminase [Serendipita sp. 396]
MPVDHFSLEAIIRPNILALQPYRCARDDYQSGILLDANENSYGHSIADKVLEATANDSSIKLIFLCSPGNPTGAVVPLSTIRTILESPSFKGLVIVDEAYIDFTEASHPGQPISATTLLPNYPNLVVLQTMSKSFGLAAIRLGFALSSPELNQILSNTKAPYNISAPTALIAMQALSEGSITAMKEKVQKVIKGRTFLLDAFSKMTQDFGPYIGGLDANFIMVPVLNRQTGKPDNERAQKVYQAMAETQGVVVRFRGKELGCTGCLRVTVGTEEENEVLLERLATVFEQIQ